ncbi:hypothetical protein KQX54_017257 [Cotesia glomerata]|uniref:Uncharacterized protein n=1 Tax=Cotesia glomerata TaxID=32391 RepID=A0AAV7I8U9_COTGL|nr:hypothetical protein KQX54_017257 [Cotesia glomerata]
MCSSSEKNGLCTKQKVYVIPTEWASYPKGTLDCIVYSGVKEHYNRYNTAKGASITIGEVSAKAKLYKGYVWMRKEFDQSQKPYSSEYSQALLDNYACKHNTNAITTLSAFLSISQFQP